MRALINNKDLTKFMQAADVFGRYKYAYHDIELKYLIADKPVEDEEIVQYLAEKEFGSDLIVIFGKDKPLSINKNVQALSTGKKWGTFLSILKQSYPNLKFNTNQYLYNITIEE